MIPLALSVQKNKGVYALLLGSGVSRSAEVPTGWDVVLDLIRQVARVDNENCEPDPASWYLQTFKNEPAYDDLLADVAKLPAERQQLLRGYFEPTDDERERGVKTPTEAHRAIAELVAGGFVRVIVTTNFDRLLEQALEAIGVVPSVIASADAAQGALPLAHTQCAIVKLHGDYLDPRIRNTPEELAEYPAPLNRLLDQVLDEYGLIVCGWSGEWDTALRAAIERCQSRRFSTYWASRRDPADAARRLINHRRAEVVQVADADGFFRRLAEAVSSLEELARPHPLTVPAVQASVKRYVVEERHRILLHDLVMAEANRVRNVLTGDQAPSLGTPFTGEELVARFPWYEALAELLMATMATGCYWGDSAQHGLWMRCLEQVAKVASFVAGTYYRPWRNLQLYPALLALYAGGIAAVAAERYDTLAALLTRGTLTNDHGKVVPTILALNSYRVMETEQARFLPGTESHYVPFNDHLFANAGLRKPLQDFLPDEQQFLAAFDRFEYLVGLVYRDLREQEGGGVWAPVGCFVRRFGAGMDVQNIGIVHEVASEIEESQDRWPPLQVGLFGGSLDRALRAKAGYDSAISNHRP